MKIHYLSVLLLIGCITTQALIRVPENLQSSEEMIMETKGAFWGFGMDGQFDLAGLYSGQYDRRAHNVSWFDDLVETKENGMVAEVLNNSSGERWLLNFSSSFSKVNIGNITIGDDDAYTGDILKSGRKQGTFILKKSGKGFEPSGKVSGKITLNDLQFTVESVHDLEGGLIPTDWPSGYYVKRNEEVVAVIQTNGRISLRLDEQLSEREKDLMVIATVASALSLREE